MTYIALHVEKWLYGSTPIEMDFDEQACFTRILCRAALTGADPPGQIYYFSEQHLATQLQVPLELLNRTLEKGKKFKKFKIKTLKRENKYALSIVNWEKFQHVYLHQKAYRQRQKAKKEAQKKQILEGTKKHNQNITDYNALVDRIGEDNIRKENIIKERKGEEIESSENPNNLNSNKSEISSLLHSNSKTYKKGEKTIKDEFMSKLKNYPGYPFNEFQDSILFDSVATEYHGINILKQLDKKISWWNEHPDALKPKANPRKKLEEWFKAEYEFQKMGGPQKIGEIMKEIIDPDHRNFLKRFIQKEPKDEGNEPF